MGATINFEDLRAACEFTGAGALAALDCTAFVSRTSGAIHWRGDGVAETLPEDIDDTVQYLALPSLHDLGLGKPLALRFVSEHLPQALDEATLFFRKRGAYSRFKALLERHGRLAAWYAFEAAATEMALRTWCEEQGFDLRLHD